MTIRSMMFAAMVAAAMALPVQESVAQSAGAVQAVPRAGVAFTNTVTVRAKVESVDVETRTMAYHPGRAAGQPCRGRQRAQPRKRQDDALVDITYSEVVNLLNLRQKGPGLKPRARRTSDPHRRRGGSLHAHLGDRRSAANKVSGHRRRGGAVQTYSANSIAKQDMLKKIKVRDVVIGITTPLTVTRSRARQMQPLGRVRGARSEILRRSAATAPALGRRGA